jgi:hypothetical protein
MSLDKAIASGKERRKPYRKSKAFDRTCRCHGSCGWCQGNRQHADVKRQQAANERATPQEEFNGE